MLVDILKEVLQNPETPAPWEPQDNEIYMISKVRKNITLVKGWYREGR